MYNQVKTLIKNKHLFRLVFLDSKVLGIRKSIYLCLLRFRIMFADSDTQKTSLRDKKHNLIREFLDNYYDVISPKDIPQIPAPLPYMQNNIWVLWWQGESNMPFIVKRCYESILKNSNGHKVILITKSNYTNYVDVPQQIIDKVNIGKMKLAHLSDFIRLQLLVRYGGLWVDSTILVTRPIDDGIFIYPFYSIHYEIPLDNISVGEYRYFVSFMACKPNNGIIYNAYKLFEKYWLMYDWAIDYLIMDYAIDQATRKCIEYQKQMQNVPFNNECAVELLEHINKPYNDEDYKAWMEKTYLFKLNWKVKAELYNNGKITFYNKILSL